MYILITYDVDTTGQEGQKRLRKVAKCCKNFGQRVQNSVFECSITGDAYVNLMSELNDIIDKESDSIRIYHFGKNYKSKIEMIGKKTSYDFDGDIII